MKHVFLIGTLFTAIAFVACAHDEEEVTLEVGIETSTATAIDWMYVGTCSPDGSLCQVMCEGPGGQGYIVLAGSCYGSSCRVPDRNGVCNVRECYGPGSSDYCSSPYERIQDVESGVYFCCKLPGA